MRLALTSVALAYSMSAEPRRSFGTEIASASPKPPRFVDVDKFDVADGAGARAHLDERGFVVFRSVLDASEVARANELFFDYVEALGSGVDRNDVSTWGDDRWPPCAGEDLCGNHSELGYAIEQTQEWRQPRVDGVGSEI